MMDGTEIKISDTMKYLGITLQRSLTWTRHLQEKIGKGVKIMNSAHAAIGQKWGLTSKKILWVYTDQTDDPIWIANLGPRGHTHPWEKTEESTEADSHLYDLVYEIYAH